MLLTRRGSIDGFFPPCAGAARLNPAIKALLVDDDPLILRLLTAFLQGRGWALDQATNGREALATLEQGGHNLVITDRHMPDMDGMALCRAIRQRATSGRGYVYCVMLTSASDEATLVEAMEAGADDFLSKPLQPAQLGARLRAAERVLALEADLARRNLELTQAYTRLSQELEMARTLQLGLLPAPAQFAPVHFEWFFQASSYVGGDTFDYFPLGAHHVCFYLVDVAGHGVPAAMMAFHAHHQLRALSMEGCERLAAGTEVGEVAAEVVANYNRQFLRTAVEDSHYLTLLYGIFDLDRRLCSVVQAGHPPAMIVSTHEDGIRCVGEGGWPIGILEDAHYHADSVPLQPGDRLALYSDGVTDCLNGQGEAFGVERLGELLVAARHGSLEQAAAGLRRALAEWRASGFEDDVTFLGMEVR